MINILEISNFCNCMIKVFIFLGHIINILKIIVPIIIVIYGSVDLIKAMMEQNQEKIQNGYSILIKRLIIGIVIFFIIGLVQFFVGLAGGDTNNRCFRCVANVNSKECDKKNIPTCKRQFPKKEANKEDKEETNKEDKQENKNTEKEKNTENNNKTSKNCRIHFDGNAPHIVRDNQTNIKYFTDNEWEMCGKQMLSSDIFNGPKVVNVPNDLPNSTYTCTDLSGEGMLSATLDSIAIDTNTHIKITCTNGIILDTDGPFVLHYDNNRCPIGGVVPHMEKLFIEGDKALLPNIKDSQILFLAPEQWEMSCSEFRTINGEQFNQLLSGCSIEINCIN